MGSPGTMDNAEGAADFARAMARLLRMQSLLVIAAGLIGLLLAGTGAAMAVMAGGGIGIVLTAVAALRSGVMAGPPERRVSAFYRGMALKLVLAVVFFIVVAVWFADAFVPVLSGYLATLAGYWVALLRLSRWNPVATESPEK